MSTRVITVYATKGKRMAKVETEVSTWSELKPLIKAEGYDLSSLHATESVNRTDLNHQDARLPEGPFTLFLRPKKTKSGISGTETMGFKDLRAEVKKAMVVDGEYAKNYFNSFIAGKNYTQLGTDQLREAVAGYNSPKLQAAPVAEQAQNVADVVESVSQAKEESPNLIEKVEKAIAIFKEICEETGDDDICDRTSELIEDAEGLLQDLKDYENPEAARAREEEARLAREAEEEERRVQEEAEDLLAGFDN